MKLELFNHEASKIWKRVSQSNQQAAIPLQLELELYKKLLVYFQIGQSCYLIFNFQQLQFDFVSEELTAILGYATQDVTLNLLMENIHPEERQWFLSCQETAGGFLMSLSPERQMKYKLQFDYRTRKADGTYTRIMQQVVVIQNDAESNILRTLIILTDISHIKKSGQPMLSYIGMDGEPSYTDVDIKNPSREENQLLSKREMSVLYLLAEGKLSKQIADELNISKYTVDTHRKNMLRKINAASTGELVHKAVLSGIL